MSQERQEIIYDTASQTLTFRSPWGRPTSTPTVGTADSGNSALTAAATTYVTLDTADTTLSASAAVGDTSITVASATGIVAGKTYPITSIIGEVEQARVRGINGTTVYLVDPLRCDYSVVSGGSYGTLEGVEFVYALQEDDYDTLSEMNVATATFTAGSLPRVMRLVFDVVRVPLNAPGALTAEAIYERFGRDLARQEPDEQRGEDFGPQRKTAWNTVRHRIYQHGDSENQWRPSMIVDSSDLLEYAYAAFARICHEQGITVRRDDMGHQPMKQLMEAEETERVLALGSISWLDVDDDKTLGEEDARPIETDFVR